MHTTSAVEHEEYANGTVFIENGVESVELPCGEVPKNAVAIQWSTFKSHEWRNILRFYPTTLERPLLYYGGYTADNYGISESVNTSLVLKDIDHSENSLFRCITAGGGLAYSYTTMIKVVGEFCRSKFNLAI